MNPMCGVIGGLGVGATVSWVNDAQEALKQGKQAASPYQCALYDAALFSNVASVGEQFINVIPNPYVRISSLAAITFASFSGLIICPVAAAVKEKQFEEVVQTLKSMPSLQPLKVHQLPDTLNEKTKTALRFVAKHLESFNKQSLVVGMLALPFIGSLSMAAGIASLLVYQQADSKGWVPGQVRTVAQRYLPFFSIAGSLVGGGVIAQWGALLNLFTYIPSSNRSLHRIVDQYCRKSYKLKGASIEEIDMPLVERKKLSFDLILKIFHGNPRQFRANPPHFSKVNALEASYPKDVQFSKFLDLFKKIDWENYPRLERSFQEDDQFMTFLKSKFQDTDVKVNFDACIQNLAEKNGISKEKLFPNLLRARFRRLVQILNGEKLAKGAQEYVDDARNFASKILPHLLKLNLDDKHQCIEFADILKRLGMEGKYCSLGLKRITEEVWNDILQGTSLTLSDPADLYEWKLYGALEAKRRNFVGQIYREMISTQAIAQDVHTFELFRSVLGLGIVPLRENERNGIGLGNFISWLNLDALRDDFYKKYCRNIHVEIRNQGQIHFANYMRRLFEQNDRLTADERNEIEELWMKSSDSLIRFERLFGVMLGILQYGEEQDGKWVEYNWIQDEEWTEVVSEPEVEESDWIKI